MANLVPMLGAVFAHAGAPKSEGKVRPKPKTTKGHRAGGTHKVTRGEGSVSQKYQQHGELASVAEPRPLSDRMQMREHAKHEMRAATEDWVAGRIATHEHKFIHERAKHVLAGKHPHEFRGKSGERKIKGLR